MQHTDPRTQRRFIRIWYAFLYSCSGIRYALLEESAFRQELVLVVILIPLAIILPLVLIERLWLISSMLLVLIVELLNSSIEAAIDRISLKQHPLSKRAKDFGSAAVLLALCVCGMSWLLLAGPLLLGWLQA